MQTPPSPTPSPSPVDDLSGSICEFVVLSQLLYVVLLRSSYASVCPSSVCHVCRVFKTFEHRDEIMSRLTDAIRKPCCRKKTARGKLISGISSTALAQNRHISTSGLKSDITSVISYPGFLQTNTQSCYPEHLFRENDIEIVCVTSNSHSRSPKVINLASHAVYFLFTPYISRIFSNNDYYEMDVIEIKKVARSVCWSSFSVPVIVIILTKVTRRGVRHGWSRVTGPPTVSCWVDTGQWRAEVGPFVSSSN